MLSNRPHLALVWLALGISVAGCAATVPRPMPLAESGPVEVVVNGASFIADLQPGPLLSVTRESGFGNDEGKLAKDVAMQFCASRKRALNPQAFGHYTGGQWVFKGGCA